MISKEDYNECLEHFKEDDFVRVESWDSTTDVIKIIIKGLDGTPYEKGNFKFQINLKSEFKSLPHRTKISKNDFIENITVGEFKRKLIKTYSQDSILAIQLIFKGKVLPDQLRFSKIGIHPEKDAITIMTTQAGYPRLWNKGKIYCETLIWHPNIDCTIPPGSENFFLGESWNPAVSLTILIEGIKALIHMIPPIFDLSIPLNKKAADQYLNNKDEFERKARVWNKKYTQQGGA